MLKIKESTKMNISKVREEFPSLFCCDDGTSRIYLDNPAGTQTPKRVIDAMCDCLMRSNANLDGYFTTSREAEAIVVGAHEAMADFLNAPSVDEITFGQNMTTLTFHISRSIGRTFSKGDEIILTRMDHDANIAPWLMLAEDLGLVIKWLDIDKDRFELDLDKFTDLLSPRTALVAIGYASNLIGTINDVKTITRKAKEVGALVYVDAVQYAPHGLVDVQDIGCDFLVCSPYKFYGPHQGVLWGKEEVLRELVPYKVRAVPDGAPDRFETGTLSHESMAGVMAAVEYYAWYGQEFGESRLNFPENITERRRNIAAAYDVMHAYEDGLCSQLLNGLQSIPSVTIHGITEDARMNQRLPTVAFTSAKASPLDIATHLGQKNIYVWDGHNYAVELTQKLGLMESGGVVRVGISHYNTAAEIDALLDAVREII